MNSELDVFHPKLSYLIDKYKIFIIKSFNKVKESIINPIPAKNEKFSVVKDILAFFAKYNKQYKEKLDLSKILQGNEEIYNIINKVSKYLLDLYFDINIIIVKKKRKMKIKVQIVSKSTPKLKK